MNFAAGLVAFCALTSVVAVCCAFIRGWQKDRALFGKREPIQLIKLKRRVNWRHGLYGDSFQLD